MKLYHITVRSLMLLLCLGLFTYCSKESTSDVIVTSEEGTEKSDRIIETGFNTDARMATIYALQHARNINPKFKLDPRSEQAPRFISGQSVEKYVNLDKLPFGKEENEFIKEILHKEGSRAILIEGIIYPKDEKKVNVLYIPYPEGIEVPKHFDNQFGVIIDGFDWYPPFFQWREIGFQRENRYCFCFKVLAPFPSLSYCGPCPFDWWDFHEILVEIIPDPGPYQEVFERPVPIEKIPLERSLFNI